MYNKKTNLYLSSFNTHICSVTPQLVQLLHPKNNVPRCGIQQEGWCLVIENYSSMSSLDNLELPSAL